MAKQLNELNKSINKSGPITEVDFKPINQKLEKVEHQLTIIKENYSHSFSDLSIISSEVRQI